MLAALVILTVLTHLPFVLLLGSWLLLLPPLAARAAGVANGQRPTACSGQPVQHGRPQRVPDGKCICSKSSAGSRVIPRRRMTACERTLPAVVIETISSRPTSSNRRPSAARAASVA